MNDYLCYCPFHGNRDTPSFTVSLRKGKFLCFNASCGEHGSLVDLVTRTTGRSHFEALRLIVRNGKATKSSISEVLTKAYEEVEDFPIFSQEVLDKNAEDFWENEEAQTYMHGRGFEDNTLKHFGIGYSIKKDMIIVPMHDPKGNPIGLVGRSLEGKRFKNSLRLPRRLTAWNFHRARASGADTVIIVESAFDAMRIHQAGYPNVVAILGGYISQQHFVQLSKSFSKIMIFTDNDVPQYNKDCAKCRRNNFAVCKGHNPGRDMGHTIEQGFKNKRVLWAAYNNEILYPHNAKDAGDMTDEEIRQCIKNALSSYEYSIMGLDSTG